MSRNCRSKKTPKGQITMGSTTAQRVSSSFSSRSVSTLGTMVTWKGSTISSTTRKAIRSLPRKRKQDRAKAKAGRISSWPARISSA